MQTWQGRRSGSGSGTRSGQLIGLGPLLDAGAREPLANVILAQVALCTTVDKVSASLPVSFFDFRCNMLLPS